MTEWLEDSPEYPTIPQLAKKMNLPQSWLYDRSRRDALPGLRQIGRYVRVNLAEFLAALEAGDLK